MPDISRLTTNTAGSWFIKVTAHRNCVAISPMMVHSWPGNKCGKILSQIGENRVYSDRKSFINRSRVRSSSSFMRMLAHSSPNLCSLGKSKLCCCMVKLKNHLTKEKEPIRFPNFLTQVLAWSQISSTGFCRRSIGSKQDTSQRPFILLFASINFF